MRLFKNRGDIYVPKTKFKSDVEQKVLISILAFIIVFTTVFVIFIGFKYDFSAKKFFTPDDLKVVAVENDDVLPQVSGKKNYLFIMNNEDTKEMYFCTVIQVDLDTLSYKAATIKNDTQIEGKKLSEIYANAGGAGVQTNLNAYLGINIDYYVDESVNNFSDWFDSLGKVNYTLIDDVRYKDTSRYGFNIKLKSGEQVLDGDKASKLLRYFAGEGDNISAVNDIFLAALSQQINVENYGQREKLFNVFIEKSETNFTVKDFTESVDGLKVLSDDTTGVNVYNVNTSCENGKLTEQSLSDIKAYFAK